MAYMYSFVAHRLHEPH